MSESPPKPTLPFPHIAHVLCSAALLLGCWGALQPAAQHFLHACCLNESLWRGGSLSIFQTWLMPLSPPHYPQISVAGHLLVISALFSLLSRSCKREDARERRDMTHKAVELVHCYFSCWESAPSLTGVFGILSWLDPNRVLTSDLREEPPTKKEELT